MVGNDVGGSEGAIGLDEVVAVGGRVGARVFAGGARVGVGCEVSAQEVMNARRMKAKVVCLFIGL